MAHEYGTVANFPGRKAQRMALIAFGLYTAFAILVGFGIGGWVMSPVRGLGTAIIFAADVLGGIMMVWLYRNEKAFFLHRKGARGEGRVAELLRELPDDYHVYHGIGLAHGDIDHLVIGPTGIFCLDAKCIEGEVVSDGNGGLRHNGFPWNHKVRGLVAKTMELREMLGYPAKEGPFFCSVLVFVHTNLKWSRGDTGLVDCLRSEKLLGHLTATGTRRAIPCEDIERLTAEARKLVG